MRVQGKWLISEFEESIVILFSEQVAKLPFAVKSLKNLCLADRAFTHSCQKYIFRELNLFDDWKWDKISSKQLTIVKKFLDDKPSIANQVRMVTLGISSEANASVFKDPDFISILHLFAKSPMPPYELYLHRKSSRIPCSSCDSLRNHSFRNP